MTLIAIYMPRIANAGRLADSASISRCGANPLYRPNHPIQCERLDFQSDRLDEFLRAAFAVQEKRHLQYGLDWLALLARTALAEGEEGCIYVCRRSPTDFIAMPLRLTKMRRQAHALANFYTSAYLPVLQTTDPKPLLAHLLRHIRETERLAVITLGPMDRRSAVFRLIEQALAASGWSQAHCYRCFGNWRADVAGQSWQDYLRQRPAALRNTIRRRTRKFLSSNQGSLELIQGCDQLDTAIECFELVYRRSWKINEPFPDFIPDLLRLAARRNWLRLGVARHQGQPVAAQIWFVWQGTAYIFKLAFDERFRHLSPGTVLSAFIMERVIDQDRVTSIDYMSGDDPFKSDWMTCRQEWHGLAAYNASTARGASMLSWHAAKQLLKKVGVARRAVV